MGRRQIRETVQAMLKKFQTKEGRLDLKGRNRKKASLSSLIKVIQTPLKIAASLTMTLSELYRMQLIELYVECDVCKDYYAEKKELPRILDISQASRESG